MKYLTKKYVEECKKIFSPYGFKQIKSTFLRSTNDVIQKLQLQQSIYPGSCVINFGIIPHCMHCEEAYILDGLCPYMLSQFKGESVWANYNWKSASDVYECVKRLISELNTSLIPMFLKANSCETAFPELLHFERSVRNTFYTNLRSRDKSFVLNSNRYESDNVPKLTGSMFYMSLKCKEYSYALEFAQLSLRQNRDALNNSIHVLTKDTIASRLESIKNIEREIMYLESGNEQYFQEMLHKNEVATIETLKKLKLTP